MPKKQVILTDREYESMIKLILHLVFEVDKYSYEKSLRGEKHIMDTNKVDPNMKLAYTHLINLENSIRYDVEKLLPEGYFDSGQGEWSVFCPEENYF